MGNCAASRLAGDEEDAVAICRDRKSLLKSAVERRYALADAHSSYIHSLSAVAAAIGLFAARHSSPDSILIALPAPAAASEPSFLRQTPTEAKLEALDLEKPVSAPVSSGGESEEEQEVGEKKGGDLGMGYGYYVREVAPVAADGGFGWDFFNPFDGMVGGLRGCSEEELRAVREEEGIPELEEEDVVKKGGSEDGKNGEVVTVEVGKGEVEREEEAATEKGLTVMGAPEKERELLEALRDVEDQFIRAYDAGKEVARMLEANQVQLQSGIDEIKENSSKIIQAITWHRSPSSQSSSSYRSYLASSSNSTSWTESKSDVFDDYGGMESGSHSQTLGRLYAWEKKLYEEVKAGESTRQVYEQKCAQLRNQDARGADPRVVDKTRAAVKDLYTRIWVALRSADTISKRIQKLRDEELHPQLIELMQGLLRTWKVMLESHDTQKQIMAEVKSFTCPAYGKYCTDSQRLATVKLEAELRHWRTCFRNYVAAQIAYVEAIDGWLSKFIVPDIDYYSRGRSSYRPGAPPLVTICHDWLASLRRLPEKPVSYAMKSFIRDIRVLWAKQGEEQQQKRKVDNLAKEFDRKTQALQKAETKVLELKPSELKPEPDVRQRVEYLTERKDSLEMFKKKLEAEKAKHRECMQETERVTLNGFTIDFSSIFGTLKEFSAASMKLYDELLVQNEKAKRAVEDEKPAYIEEGSHMH
ncbi:hypothetical protein J5N97_023948 [Dioscorea zingiberensis]|uniref:DUF632 domain-containing protein n=1 Tax=Dioscorea zingiberensis TaxID=325984 RepID=A0A9D5C5I6_9LILI|nr:hypothetical protein J5N97_023948 [Dioscorea zingiberensis]